MRIEKITLLIVLFVLSFSLFGSEPVVSIGVVMEPLTLDPALAMDNASLEAVHNLFDTLTVYNPATSRVEPSLAVSWRHSTDGKEWVLQLRKGSSSKTERPSTPMRWSSPFKDTSIPGSPSAE